MFCTLKHKKRLDEKHQGAPKISSDDICFTSLFLSGNIPDHTLLMRSIPLPPCHRIHMTWICIPSNHLHTGTFLKAVSDMAHLFFLYKPLLRDQEARSARQDYLNTSHSVFRQNVPRMSCHRSAPHREPEACRSLSFRFQERSSPQTGTPVRGCLQTIHTP